MGKAGKLLIGGIAALIVVVGIAVVFLISNLDSIVKRAIETVGSDVAGVPVSVGSVEISLQESRGAINGLRIANPPGFGGGDAVELGTVALDLDVKNSTGELVVIKSILVDGTQVNVVQNVGGSNLKVLQDKLSSDSDTDEQPAADEGAAGTKLIIDDFQFRNGEVSLALQGVAERNAGIPDFTLTGVGRKSNGATAAEAAKQILDPLIRKSITAASGISGIEDLGEKAVETVLKDAPEEAVKGLGGLLKRDKD
jgi:hypothetical protein